MSQPKLTVRYSLVWIDVQFDTANRKAAEFQQDFTRWVSDNDVFPAGQGHSGPLGCSGAYTERNAEKLLAWLKERGIRLP